VKFIGAPPALESKERLLDVEAVEEFEEFELIGLLEFEELSAEEVW
jgi:hypothetical protein